MRRALRAEGRADAARLHLDEDQRRAIEGDDVQFSRWQADIPPDEPPARQLEPDGDQPLRPPAELQPREGHRAILISPIRRVALTSQRGRHRTVTFRAPAANRA